MTVTVLPRVMEEATFSRDGYRVIRGAVPQQAVDNALWLINSEIPRSGIDPSTYSDCLHNTFFPHLRGHQLIRNLAPEAFSIYLAEMCEPQILLRFPDEEQECRLVPHVDEVPPWANGRRYMAIVGVALSDCGPRDGALHVWPGSHRNEMRLLSYARGTFTYELEVSNTEPVPVPMKAGDAVVMHPNLAHAGSLNLGPNIRYSVYFRYLEPVKAAA